MRVINYFKKHRQVSVALFFFGFSFLLLLVCTTSSPLYQVNEWVDSNAYFTMGKGLMNGKVLYRDLFDHKGPFLYLIYGIGYLFSHNSFFGVFVMESLALGVTLYFVYKIAKLFLLGRPAALSAVLFGLLFVAGRHFSQGGSAEEFMAPFLTMALYFAIVILNDGADRPQKAPLFALGFCTAAIFLIKMNIIMALFPIMLVIFVRCLLNKNLRIFFINALFYVAGLCVLFVPFFLYFLATGSLKDFLYAYITFNASYAQMETGAPAIVEAVARVMSVLQSRSGSAVLLLLGCASIVRAPKRHLSVAAKSALMLSLVFLLFFVYNSSKYFAYSFLIVVPFLSFGILFAVNAVLRFAERGSVHPASVLVTAALMVVLALFVNSNFSNAHKITDKEAVQPRFAKIINAEKDPTLLNFMTLDMGFYTYANLMPPTKYFYIPNIPAEKDNGIRKSQIDLLESAQIQFIVIREYQQERRTELRFPVLTERYMLVDDAQQKYEGNIDIYYRLYKLKEA